MRACARSVGALRGAEKPWLTAGRRLPRNQPSQPVRSRPDRKVSPRADRGDGRGRIQSDGCGRPHGTGDRPAEKSLGGLAGIIDVGRVAMKVRERLGAVHE